MVQGSGYVGPAFGPVGGGSSVHIPKPPTTRAGPFGVAFTAMVVDRVPFSYQPSAIYDEGSNA